MDELCIIGVYPLVVWQFANGKLANLVHFFMMIYLLKLVIGNFLFTSTYPLVI